MSRPEDGPGGLLTPRVVVVPTVDNASENRIQIRLASARAILGESRTDIGADRAAISDLTIAEQASICARPRQGSSRCSDPLAGLRALTTPARSSAAAFTDGQGTNLLLTRNRHGRMLKILSVLAAPPPRPEYPTRITTSQ